MPEDTKRVWCLLAIGSAGHGVGIAKGCPTKDATGALDTDQDLRDCVRWWTSYDDGDKVFGRVNCSGDGITPTQVLDSIKRFFNYCKDNGYAPVIYYTGHGFRNGDWAFAADPATGKNSVTKEDLDERIPAGCILPRLLIDACNAGSWVDFGNTKRWYVATASGSNDTTKNRQFALAVFSRCTCSNRTCSKCKASTTFNRPVKTVNTESGWELWTPGKEGIWSRQPQHEERLEKERKERRKLEDDQYKSTGLPISAVVREARSRGMNIKGNIFGGLSSGLGFGATFLYNDLGGGRDITIDGRVETWQAVPFSAAAGGALMVAQKKDSADAIIGNLANAGVSVGGVNVGWNLAQGVFNGLVTSVLPENITGLTDVDPFQMKYGSQEISLRWRRKS